MLEKIPLSLYIHFPWCVRKCPYCDFNSHAVKAGIPEKAYVAALLNDLRSDLALFNETRPLTSVFLGGGTPSLFSPQALDGLLTGIRGQIDLADDVEITLEANPGTVEAAKFAEYRGVGVNRLSIGVQSFHDDQLQKLGRIHSAGDAVKAAEIAAKSGFENFNLDLMFGLPGGNLKQVASDIDTALALRPSHISFYQLTLEPNTEYYLRPPPLPDDEEIYNAGKMGREKLENRGYRQYEISAYAKEEHRCRHNLNYWRFGDYLGIGAGAHGKITQGLPDRIRRYWKIKHPQKYLQRAGTGQGFGGVRFIPRSELPLEFMMNRLRLKHGFRRGDLYAGTGLALQAIEPGLSRCIQRNWLIDDGNRIACSELGWNFLDSVLEQFLPD